MEIIMFSSRHSTDNNLSHIQIECIYDDRWHFSLLKIYKNNKLRTKLIYIIQEEQQCLYIRAKNSIDLADVATCQYNFDFFFILYWP